MARAQADGFATPPPHRNSFGERIRDAVRAFADLARLPRAFWFVILAFVFESMAYFGVLTLMTVYLGTDLGWGDGWAGLAVSTFTMLVTLFMLGAGSYAESFGLRRAIIAALVICVIGRLMYTLGAGQALAAGVVLVVAALLIIAIGEAILQPVCPRWPNFFARVCRVGNLRYRNLGTGMGAGGDGRGGGLRRVGGSGRAGGGSWRRAGPSYQGILEQAASPGGD